MSTIKTSKDEKKKSGQNKTLNKNKDNMIDKSDLKPSKKNPRNPLTDDPDFKNK